MYSKIMKMILAAANASGRDARKEKEYLLEASRMIQTALNKARIDANQSRMS
jgi:hypothetical protein